MRKARVAAPSPLNFSDENTLDLGLDSLVLRLALDRDDSDAARLTTTS